jgi:hypothetical protein
MLSVRGWNRQTRRAAEAELARQNKALKEEVRLRPVEGVLSRSRGYGQVPMAIFGSKGASTVAEMLMNFERMGAEDYVGPLLLAELARDVREQCIDAIPSVFHNRIIQVEAEMLIGGLGGRSIAEAQAIEKFWFRELRMCTDRSIEAIDANRGLTKVSPLALMVEMSAAGHAALGYHPIKTFTQHFPMAPVYANTILDTFPDIRERYLEMCALFDPEGLIDGYNLTDNALNLTRNDFGSAHLWPAATVGKWLTTEGTGILNGFGRIFPRTDKGRTGTMAVWAESIPAYFLESASDKVPGVFYTSPGVVQEKIMRGIETILTDTLLMALPFPPAPKGSPKSLHVIAPIVPEDFADDIAAVQDRIGSWLKELDPGVTVNFVSCTQPLHPGGTGVITLVLLLGVDAGPDEIEDLAKGAYSTPVGFLSAGNGHKPPTDVKRLAQPSDSKSPNKKAKGKK